MAVRALTLRILLLALAARLLVFASATRDVFPVGEGRTQADLAVNILEGNGFMLSESMLHPENEAGAPLLFRRSFEFYRKVDGYYGALRPGRPTVFLVPGYALFMAGIFGLFGPFDYLAVRGVQLLLGLITVYIGLRIAGRFLKGKYLVLAGLFLALDPFELYYEAVPATQALFSLFFLLAILLSMRLMDAATRRGGYLLRSVLAGCAWAAAFYVRPVSLPVMSLAAVLLFFAPLVGRILARRDGGSCEVTGGILSLRGAASAMTMLGVFAVLMLPWGLRNQSVTGTFRIMPAQGGVNLWEYNGRIFTEHFQGEAQGALTLYGGIRREYMGRLNSPELAQFPEFTDEPEWTRDSVLYSRNIRFMIANPVLTMRLITLRFVEMFKPFPLNSFSPLYTLAGLLAMFPVLFFLWGGAARCAFHGGIAGFFLSTLVAGYTLMHLLTATGTPHRVAIDFPMAILAVLGLSYSVGRFTAWRELRSG
ncbi:MAG: glycosyltransferase family 39 protein [Candidatus Fermentibacteraceae bacterium]|nr:glycosyltransferase family 39 protein [Candidatus Fermentibacteraceae bacterium]MBN2608671.1 glycosyltransferase family 39 protein [Candidatus Fermentibacteraceae bacterium]